ncbi:unnamed protein product, partial [Ectocarpus sp. 12 AP-2014]
ENWGPEGRPTERSSTCWNERGADTFGYCYFLRSDKWFYARGGFVYQGHKPCLRPRASSASLWSAQRTRSSQTVPFRKDVLTVPRSVSSLDEFQVLSRRTGSSHGFTNS